MGLASSAEATRGACMATTALRISAIKLSFFNMGGLLSEGIQYDTRLSKSRPCSHITEQSDLVNKFWEGVYAGKEFRSCRSSGVTEERSIGVLEYWSIGVLECWSVGVLECCS